MPTPNKLPIKDYKDLIVWQKSFKLVQIIYKLTQNLPKSELFGLTSQIQRASISIPSNIAEGSNRGHKPEYIQFLSIALGSTAELETQLLLCKTIYESTTPDEALELLKEIQKMLRVLIKNLKYP